MTEQITAFIAKMAMLSITYLFDAQNMFHIAMFMIFADLVTGIWRSVCAGGYKTITSRKLKRTVVKIAAYVLAILSTFILEKELLGSGITVTKIVTGMICLVELASIMENLSFITGNSVFIRIFDLFKTKLNTNKDIINSITGETDDKKPTGCDKTNPELPV